MAYRVAVALTAPLLSLLAAGAPVRTQQGPIEGVEENGALVYKGIPFAAPPVGPLRWRAPQPPAPWPQLRHADHFSPICMQKGAYPEDSPPEASSEDCLYLNVWVPPGKRDAPLPVMVWIYGGALANGSASTPLYAGDALSQRGVIVVTANYRLGAFGFLAHPELTKESPDRVSGNYGLLDQLQALRWVQGNIAAFGGDPRNVTVFGQSSGSISISALTTSPLARGLFERAIGQSGGLFEPLEAVPEFKLEGAELVGRAFAAKLGAGSLQALRALPAAAILARPFDAQPNIDGYVLRETPYAAYAHGRQNEVDILVGSNAGEGLYFAHGRTIGAANLSNELAKDFPAFIVSLIGPKTPRDDQAARDAFLEFEGDMRFGWNMWAWARLNAAAGARRTYLYRFSHVPPGEAGASHGAEMPYVFDHPDVRRAVWAEDDQLLAHTMAAYWTNFAKTGDPNGAGLPEWPQFSTKGEETLLIGSAIRVGGVPGESNLAAIDRLYWSVRVALKYGYAAAIAAGVLVLALLWRLATRASRLRRRRSRRSDSPRGSFPPAP